MKIKNDIKQKREVIKRYIQNNPSCTYREIKRATKLKVERYYKNMKEAYKDANIIFSKNLIKRTLEEQKEDVIGFIKLNPSSNISEIQNKTKVNVIRAFGSILKAYKEAGIKYHEKDITSGVRNPFIVKRCIEYEKRVINLLKKFGDVKPKIRIENSIIDCLFIYNNKKYIVEIKDFRGKNNITMFELKQLLNYMKILKINDGLLICPKESFPKRKNSLKKQINELKISILSDEDIISNLPEKLLV
ncbi:hypothetical protein CEE44_02070 [Candidatus Woesearchaeota archaeon B3_Woes]|nr:MAG: hypothetical protein CEE44_02070 [Candidatus Woesearchaeota archaeon B3_Woes]